MKDILWNMINSSSARCGPRNIDMKKNDEHRGALSFYRKSESGVALLIVLILSAVALALMTALIYMTTVGTQTSGMQKKYHSALEAGIAGKDVVALVIREHGDLSTLGNLGLVPTVSTACTGTSVNSGTPYQQLTAKIMTSTTGTTGNGWSSGCNTYLKIDPLTSTSYDLKFTLGNNPQYIVYTKIVDTVEGNTGGSSNSGGNTLVTQGVISSTGGEVTVQSIPYLYTIEIDAENANPNSKERAKLQVLYQN